MPRANRYFLPGHVWHITHRCHKKEFLLKFANMSNGVRPCISHRVKSFILVMFFSTKGLGNGETITNRICRSALSHHLSASNGVRSFHATFQNNLC